MCISVIICIVYTLYLYIHLVCRWSDARIASHWDSKETSSGLLSSGVIMAALRSQRLFDPKWLRRSAAKGTGSSETCSGKRQGMLLHFFPTSSKLSTIPSMNGTCFSACAHVKHRPESGIVHRKGCNRIFESGFPWRSDLSWQIDNNNIIKHWKYQSFMHLDGLKPW
jgi:hypothetical protein